VICVSKITDCVCILGEVEDANVELPARQVTEVPLFELAEHPLYADLVFGAIVQLSDDELMHGDSKATLASVSMAGEECVCVCLLCVCVHASILVTTYNLPPTLHYPPHTHTHTRTYTHILPYRPVPRLFLRRG
jgi:hypothetical protein